MIFQKIPFIFGVRVFLRPGISVSVPLDNLSYALTSTFERRVAIVINTSPASKPSSYPPAVIN